MNSPRQLLPPAELFSRLVSRPNLAAIGAYVFVGIALFALLAKSLGPLEAALAGATLLVAAMAPGAAVVRLLLPRSGLFHLMILGMVVGLGLWSIGGFVSHLTGLYVIRWVPSGAAICLWLVRRRRDPHGNRRTPLLAVGGAVVAVLTLIPPVRVALATQPTSWTGWYSFYPDLPFQAAIASEGAARVAQDVPWVAGTPLSYTWAFHSAMGVWSSTSTVPAIDLVFQAWPVIFAILIPGLIAIVAWELTRITLVAAVAPVVYTLAHGLALAPLAFQQLPLMPLSPTRDFGHLFMLLVIMLLAKLLGRGSLRALSPAWLAALFLATFVATAAKGSELPVMLGGVMATLFVLVVTRRAALSDLLATAVFGAAGMVGFMIAIPDTATARQFGWGPFTFLGEGTPHRELLSAAIIALLLGAIVAFWFTLARPGARVIPSLFVGSMLAGVLGLALLNQSGGSQNYFWQAVEPIVAIALVWSGYLAIRRFGRVTIIAAIGVCLGAQIAAQSALDGVVVALAIVVLALIGAAVIVRVVSERGGSIDWRQVALIVLLLTQAAQLTTLPVGQVGGSVSAATDPSAIESSQLAAFEYIRQNSSANDIIATNAHCRAGSLAQDCDPRHFILSAVSQRRVLVEGWSYTQNGPSRDWVHDQLVLSDGFITAPTTSQVAELKDVGVRFVYVDTRLPWSRDIDRFGELIYMSEWARVYRLG